MPDITITVTTAQATRLAVAFGTHLGLTNAQGQNRSAIATEVRQWLVDQLKRVVITEERAVEEQKITVPDLNVT